MAKIFISYSHEDEDWLDYVRSHLRTAEFADELDLWDDRKLMGGDDWEAEIAKALAECRVCILLVSRHSLTSDYIARVEMRTALERARSQGVRMYPIFVSWTHVADDHWLRKFNWRPTEPLQSLSEDTGERDKVMVAIVAEIVKLAAASPSVGTAPHGATPIIDLSALSDTSLVTLRGRDAELARLDVAWDDPSIHVFSVVAWGGQGKTALVSTWVDRLNVEGGRGAEALLAWSFYNQGTKERETSADRFLDWALKKLGLADPGPSATQKAEKIAEALQHRRVLFLLDGLEPLQHGPGPQEGQLNDPALRALLWRAAANGVAGLILVTTRLAVQDIAGRRNGAAPVLDLTKLSDEAGAQLLKDRKVKGPEKELRAAARDFGGHALALTLLSGFLVRRHGGEISRRDRVGPMVADKGREMDRIHGHARRVMKSMDEEWLRRAPLHAAIMRTIGLFHRPASAACLEALRQKPALSGLKPWQAADTNARADAIFELREAGLLLAEDEHAPDSLDAHPLAREWFGEKFRRENEAGFKAAHGRVDEHLRDTTEEGDPPKDVTALDPLFQAVAHGCKAGRQREALYDVYMSRICRRGPDGRFKFHAQDMLGAIGPCLAAVAWFFDKPFEAAHANLTATDQSWVVGEAATLLSNLGRLGEARDAQNVALDMVVTAKNKKWRNVIELAANLAETELALGQIEAAVAASERGRKLLTSTKRKT